VAAAIEFELMVMFPLAPDVPDTRLSRDPEESVSTLAVIPTPDELIAEASPDSVLFVEPSVMVCAVPVPTFSVMDPDKVVEELATGAKYPLEVKARLFTTTVCVPAFAEDVAAVSSSTFVSELDPVFCAMIPVKSVSWLRSFERFDIKVPRLEIAVSCACREVNCVFQGVSTF
jgi:hypothetical protein